MKLLLIGTAITVVAGAALFGQAQAAPITKDPMCSMGSQASSESWMDHYGCWKGPMVKVAAPKPSKKDPMCSMGSQSGSQSWAAYYHCW
jgi:hypothetical protein